MKTGLIVNLGAEFYPPALPAAEPEAMVEEDDGPQPIVEGQPTIFEPNPPPPKPKKLHRENVLQRARLPVAGRAKESQIDMQPHLEAYKIDDVDRIITPALLIYPELVDVNIKATLRMLENSAEPLASAHQNSKARRDRAPIDRSRHSQFQMLHDIELLTACQAGATDVLLAYPIMGANAQRTLEIAEDFPRTDISVLVEAFEQAAAWKSTRVSIFVDVQIQG